MLFKSNIVIYNQNIVLYVIEITWKLPLHMLYHHMLTLRGARHIDFADEYRNGWPRVGERSVKTETNFEVLKHLNLNLLTLFLWTKVHQNS